MLPALAALMTMLCAQGAPAPEQDQYQNTRDLVALVKDAAVLVSVRGEAAFTFPSGKRYLVGCGVYNRQMDKALIEDLVNRAAALV